MASSDRPTSPHSVSLPADPKLADAFWRMVQQGDEDAVNAVIEAGGSCRISANASLNRPGGRPPLNTNVAAGTSTDDAPPPPPTDFAFLFAGNACPSIPPDLLRDSHSSGLKSQISGEFNNNTHTFHMSANSASGTGAAGSSGRGGWPCGDDSFDTSRQLGCGAFGAVHAANCPENGRVARKIVPLSSDCDGAALAAVKTELAIGRALAARAGDPRLLTVHRVASKGAAAIVDMELLDGGSLAAIPPLLRRAGDASGADAALYTAAAIARLATAGLAALHDDLRIVHRDIKPENILLGGDGRLRIVDFGCAAVAPGSCVAVSTSGGSAPHRRGTLAPGATADSSDLFATDQRGTTAYMSPERLCGEPHGFASDVWALGVTIAVLATGRHPFLPADGASSGVTDRFWQLAEVIHHTASTEDCEAATRRAVAAAFSKADAGNLGRVTGLVRDFVDACTVADPAQRPSAASLLATSPLIAALGDDAAAEAVLAAEIAACRAAAAAAAAAGSSKRTTSSAVRPTA